MCSIFGSSRLDQIPELLELNNARGGWSWSFAGFGPKRWPHVSFIYKGMGRFPKHILEVKYSCSYYLGHVQISTSSERSGIERVHPAAVKDDLLWHNGLLHRGWLDKDISTRNKWDTEVLLSKIQEYPYKKEEMRVRGLGSVPGSYACVKYNGLTNSISVFRNNHAQLHYGENLQLSSMAFSGSKLLENNKIFILNLEDEELHQTATFKTFDDTPLYNITK